MTPSNVDSKTTEFNTVNTALSNFYYCSVWFEGITYPSVEHAYQAAKTLDPAERFRISRLVTPGEAKHAGKSLRLRLDWEAVGPMESAVMSGVNDLDNPRIFTQTKVHVMRRLLREKFRHLHTREVLLGTGDRRIVERNTWGDRFWGVCKGSGFNVLGQLLMQERERLRAEGVE